MAGEHADSQAVFFGVAAVAVFSPRSRCSAAPRAGTPGAHRARRMASRMALRAAAAGALIGLGFAVKVTIALLGAGPGRRGGAGLAPRRLRARAPRGWRFLAPVAGGLAAGFAVVAGAALALGGRDGFRQTVQASSMVSIGSPWRAVRTLLHLGIGEAAADDVVKIAAVVLAAALAVLLLRGPAAARRRGAPSGARSSQISRPAPTVSARSLTMRARGPRPIRRRCPRDSAGRAALAFALAWLLAWPYVLPWYDALAWALLPLVAASSLDWLLLARTSALAFGYLPARVAGVVMPVRPGLAPVRWSGPGVTPAVLAIVTVWVVVSMRRGRAASTRPGRRCGAGRRRRVRAAVAALGAAAGRGRGRAG